jgi:hypothetical protein
MKFFTFILFLVATLCFSTLKAQNYGLGSNGNSEVKLFYIEDNQKPAALSLKQNYPNPFKNFTNFEFVVPRDGKIKLAIYSLLGKEITVLVDQDLASGRYRVEWESNFIEAGVYFYILESDGQSITKSFKIIR